MPDLFTCAIPSCDWTHRDDGPPPIPVEPGSDEAHAHATLHQAALEHALRAHYETHDTEAWVRCVAQLRAGLAGRDAPLLCVPCCAEVHGGQRDAANPAALVVGGDSTCLGHVQFGTGPQIPGRTPGGLILGGG